MGLSRLAYQQEGLRKNTHILSHNSRGNDMKRNEMDRLWLEQIGAFVDGFQGVPPPSSGVLAPCPKQPVDHAIQSALDLGLQGQCPNPWFNQHILVLFVMCCTIQAIPRAYPKPWPCLSRSFTARQNQCIFHAATESPGPIR